MATKSEQMFAFLRGFGRAFTLFPERAPPYKRRELPSNVESLRQDFYLVTAEYAAAARIVSAEIPNEQPAKQG